jgi:hypothetical protein
MLLLCRIFSCSCTHTLDATLQDLLFHLHTHTGCCVVGSSLAFAHTHTGCYVVVSSLALAHAHALDATSWGRLLLLSWWPCQLEKAGSFTLPETFDQKPCLIFLNMLNSVMSARWNFVIGVAIHMNTKKKMVCRLFRDQLSYFKTDESATNPQAPQLCLSLSTPKIHT